MAEEAVERKENWRPIPHFEEYYQISDMGRVWSARKEGYLKSRMNKDDYLEVRLTGDTTGERCILSISRLVAQSFHPNWDPELTVDHLNHNKQDNRIENLAVVPRSINSSRKRLGASGYYGVRPGKYRFRWRTELEWKDDKGNKHSWSISGNDAEELARLREEKINELGLVRKRNFEDDE